MKAPPIIRSANFVARTDLMRSQASFAKQKAKQMMGSGNPNTGAEIRKPGSGQCPTCRKWHRLGSVCPNTKKSVPTEALFRSHGENTIMRNDGGNPYRTEGGAWAGTPGATAQVATPGMMQLEQEVPQDLPPELQAQIQEQMMQPPAGVSPQAPQPAPAPPPQPIATQGTQGLLNFQAPAVPSPATPQEQQQQLMDSSQHMQGQNMDYMEALQNWQAKYGGQ